MPEARGNFQPVSRLSVRSRAALLDGSVLLSAGILLCSRFFHAGVPVLQPGDDLRLNYEALLNSRGSLIYRDFFEFAQPGLVFLFQAWGAVAGFGVLQLNWALAAIWLCVTFSVWRIGTTVVPAAWAAVAAASTLLWCVGAQPLYHACATTLLLWAVTVVEPPPSCPVPGSIPRRALIAGFLVGMAVVTMQSRGVVGGVVLLVWMWRRMGLQAAILFTGAAAVPLAAITCYFALNDGLVQWFRFTFLFALTRSALGSWGGPHVFVESVSTTDVSEAVRSAMLYLPVLLATIAAAAATGLRSAPARLRLLAWLVLSQIIAVLYGPDPWRLLAGTFPGFIVVCWFARRSRGHTVWLWMAAGMLAVALGRDAWRAQTAAYTVIPDRVAKSVVKVVPSDESRRYEWVLRHTVAGETVAFYPWENDLLFLGDLRNPAKFLWLDEGGFNSDAEIASVVDSLRRETPKIAMWNRVLRNDSSEVPLRWLKPLRTYLSECYVPIATFAYAEVLQYRGNSRDCRDDVP